MASVDSISDTPYTQPKRGGMTLADAFVATAMGIVAMAVALGLIIQVGIDLPLSVALAIFSYLAMLTGHVALRRAEERNRLRRAAGISPSPTITPERLPPNMRKPASASSPGRPAAPPSLAVRSGAPAVAAPPKSPPPAANPESNLRPERAATDDSKIKQLDLGNFRPRAPSELAAAPAAKPATEPDGGNIDDMIKRLANDIEAGRKPIARQEKPQPVAAGTAPPPLPKSSPETGAAAPAGEAPTLAQGALPASEAGPAGAPGSAAQPSAAAAPQPAASAKLAAIADALSDEQMEVFLETINDLEDYRAQHYQVSVRLKLADGSMLENPDYISETRGTALLPLLEAVKVSSTKRLAVQMIRRGRSGEFFSTVDGEALSDGQFSEDVDTITGSDPKLASRLVLAFTQADVRSLAPAQQQTLDAIAALGFRFSIEEITDLDMDFEALAQCGFTFAKLDSEVFLNGLPTGSDRIPATDICQHLARSGLALIVGNITDEASRAKILGFGAVLGQGPLFGAPRSVRADVLRPGEQRPSA